MKCWRFKKLWKYIFSHIAFALQFVILSWHFLHLFPVDKKGYVFNYTGTFWITDHNRRAYLASSCERPCSLQRTVSAWPIFPCLARCEGDSGRKIMVIMTTSPGIAQTRARWCQARNIPEIEQWNMIENIQLYSKAQSNYSCWKKYFWEVLCLL